MWLQENCSTNKACFMWISHQVFNAWCEIIQHKKNRCHQYCKVVPCSNCFTKSFFMLCFISNICSISWKEVHLFQRTVIFIQFLLPLVMVLVTHFSQVWSSNSLFLLVSLCPNYRGQWGTTTHEGLVPLLLKQSVKGTKT